MVCQNHRCPSRARTGRLVKETPRLWKPPERPSQDACRRNSRLHPQSNTHEQGSGPKGAIQHGGAGGDEKYLWC